MKMKMTLSLIALTFLSPDALAGCKAPTRFAGKFSVIATRQIKFACGEMSDHATHTIFESNMMQVDLKDEHGNLFTAVATKQENEKLKTGSGYAELETVCCEGIMDTDCTPKGQPKNVKVKDDKLTGACLKHNRLLLYPGT